MRQSDPISGLQVACTGCVLKAVCGREKVEFLSVFFLSAKEGRKGKHSVVSMLSHGGVVLFNLSHSCLIQGRARGSWGEEKSDLVGFDFFCCWVGWMDVC